MSEENQWIGFFILLFACLKLADVLAFICVSIETRIARYLDKKNGIKRKPKLKLLKGKTDEKTS